MKLNKFGCTVIIFFLLGFVSQAGAWHVTIYNPTAYAANVSLHKAYCGYSQEVIPPRSSYTFKTGACCPVSIEGRISSPGEKDIELTCLGPRGEPDEDAFPCTANCKNSQWTILKSEDESWHFKKGAHTDDAESDELGGQQDENL